MSQTLAAGALAAAPAAFDCPRYHPRLITLSDQSSVLRGRTIPSTLPIWPAKDPTEVLTYYVDFSRLLQEADTLVRVQPAVVGDASVSIGAYDHSGTCARIVLGGGIDGLTARVLVKILSSAGETILRTILLPIVAQPYSALVPPFGLTLPDQVTFTDPRTGQTMLDPKTGEPWVLSTNQDSTVAVTDPVTGKTMTVSLVTT